MTPRILRASPRPLSTKGIGTATLSPTSPAFESNLLRFTMRSACESCASLARFLSCVISRSRLVSGDGLSGGDSSWVWVGDVNSGVGYGDWTIGSVGGAVWAGAAGSGVG